MQLSDIDLIRSLENAKSIKIKMNGDKYYDTQTLVIKYLKNVEIVMTIAFIVLHCQYPSIELEASLQVLCRGHKIVDIH